MSFGRPGVVERLEAEIVRPRVDAQVVPEPEIQHQLARHAASRPAPIPRTSAARTGSGTGRCRSCSVRMYGEIAAQIPRVGVERIRKDATEAGRAGTVPFLASIVAAAHRAVLAVLEVADELAAELQVVMAVRVVRHREVVANLPDLLVAMPRRVRVGVDREARERDARIAVGDARRLPVLRPGDERVVREPVVAVAAANLVEHAIAQHLRELPDVFLVPLVVVDRRGRMASSRSRRQTDRSCAAPTPCP